MKLLILATVLVAATEAAWPDKPPQPDIFMLPAGKREEKRLVRFDPCNKLPAGVVTKRKIATLEGGHSLFWDPCNQNSRFHIMTTRNEDKKRLVSNFWDDPCNKLPAGVVTKRFLSFDSGHNMRWDPCLQNSILTKREEKRSIVQGLWNDPCNKLPAGVVTKRKIAEFDGGQSMFWDPCHKSTNPFSFVATRSEEKRSIVNSFRFDPCNKLPAGVVTRRRLAVLDGKQSMFWDPCNRNNPFDMVATRSEEKRSIVQGLWNDPCNKLPAGVVTKRRIAKLDGGQSLFWDPCHNSSPFSFVSTRSEEA